ncbi:hypothetical protein P692DRAFT_20403730 [Suillus brevipes Sb2]|nr:hypothetical protein P692DRAFT_20403730 [Suillus brevipes Sb2]
MVRGDHPSGLFHSFSRPSGVQQKGFNSQAGRGIEGRQRGEGPLAMISFRDSTARDVLEGPATNQFWHVLSQLIYRSRKDLLTSLYRLSRS